MVRQKFNVAETLGNLFVGISNLQNQDVPQTDDKFAIIRVGYSNHREQAATTTVSGLLQAGINEGIIGGNNANIDILNVGEALPTNPNNGNVLAAPNSQGDYYLYVYTPASGFQPTHLDTDEVTVVGSAPFVTNAGVQDLHTQKDVNNYLYDLIVNAGGSGETYDLIAEELSNGKSRITLSGSLGSTSNIQLVGSDGITVGYNSATELNVNGDALLRKAGGTMTGGLNVNVASPFDAINVNSGNFKVGYNGAVSMSSGITLNNGNISIKTGNCTVKGGVVQVNDSGNAKVSKLRSDGGFELIGDINLDGTNQVKNLYVTNSNSPELKFLFSNTDKDEAVEAARFSSNGLILQGALDVEGIDKYSAQFKGSIFLPDDGTHPSINIFGASSPQLALYVGATAETSTRQLAIFEDELFVFAQDFNAVNGIFSGTINCTGNFSTSGTLSVSGGGTFSGNANENYIFNNGGTVQFTGSGGVLNYTGKWQQNKDTIYLLGNAKKLTYYPDTASVDYQGNAIDPILIIDGKNKQTEFHQKMLIPQKISISTEAAGNNINSFLILDGTKHFNVNKNDNTNISSTDTILYISSVGLYSYQDITLNNKKVTGVATPTASSDAVPLSYLSSSLAGYYNKSEIDLLTQQERGTGHSYVLDNFVGTPTIRPGEFSTNNRTINQITAITMGATDDDGGPVREAIAGDTIDIEVVETSTTYRFTVVSGSDYAYVISFNDDPSKGTDQIEISNNFKLYIYPTSIDPNDYFNKVESNNTYLAKTGGSVTGVVEFTKNRCNDIGCGPLTFAPADSSTKWNLRQDSADYLNFDANVGGSYSEIIYFGPDGGGSFAGPVEVGQATSDNHAVRKYYVDTQFAALQALVAAADTSEFETYADELHAKQQNLFSGIKAAVNASTDFATLKSNILFALGTV